MQHFIGLFIRTFNTFFLNDFDASNKDSMSYQRKNHFRIKIKKENRLNNLYYTILNANTTPRETLDIN